LPTAIDYLAAGSLNGNGVPSGTGMRNMFRVIATSA
jgi:hypothetical protein